MSSKSRIPIFNKKPTDLLKAEMSLSKEMNLKDTSANAKLIEEFSKTELYQYSRSSFIGKREAFVGREEQKTPKSIKETRVLEINSKLVGLYPTNTIEKNKALFRKEGNSILEYPRPQRFEESTEKSKQNEESNNPKKKYESLKNSIKTFKNKFTHYNYTSTDQSDLLPNKSLEKIYETSSPDEHIYDNHLADYKYLDDYNDDDKNSEASNTWSDKTETLIYSAENIDDTIEAIIDDNHENISNDSIEENDTDDLTKCQNNTALNETNEDFLKNPEIYTPFNPSSNSLIDESPNVVYSKSKPSLDVRPVHSAKNLFKTRSFNESKTNIAFIRNFKRLNSKSLYSSDKFLELEAEPFFINQEKMLSLKPSGVLTVKRGIIKKSCSSGEIHGKPKVDQKQNNNLIISVRTKPFENQETIIEECKNSLNELIKASKWPDKTNSSISHNLNSLDSLRLDKIPALNLSQSSSVTSSMSSNLNDNTLNKSSGFTQLFDKHPKKILNSTEPIFASPTAIKKYAGEKNINSKRVCNNDYDNYEFFVQSNDALANDSETICIPASNLVGGASQFNSNLFHLKNSQSIMTDQINSLNLIINDETEDLSCDQRLPSKEESIKKSSYIKSNNSSSKFYTRSTSVNNLKYSNFQSIASRIAATKTQSNKNQSSGRLNQNFDESILRPATGNWLSSSSSDAIDLNLSISSFASPNQNQSENQSKGCRSGSAKLIIKKKKTNKKCSASTNTVEQQGALDQIDENHCKRFSTHSEILAASNTNNLLDKDSFTKTLPQKLQRRSTPSATIKSTDSLNSFQSITSSSVNSNISLSTHLSMNSKFPSTFGVFSSNVEQKPPVMTRSKSRKSLSSKPENAQKNFNQNFVDEDNLEPTNHLNNRKQNNSWIAQSFRKAFFGSNSKKTKLSATHKSQIQINSTNSNLSLSNNQVNPKMTSSVSVHNCALASYDSKYQRNSCSDNSKRSSLSDDEQDECESLHHRFSNNNKFSLPPDNNNDSDSEFEKKFPKNFETVNSALINKRSYRSESELANKLQLAPSIATNHISVINYNESENVTTSKNIKQYQPQNQKLATPQQQPYGNSHLKMSTSHKSVTSLLTTSNAKSCSLEINQPQSFNRVQEGSNVNLMLTNENINRNQKKICNCKINETIITDLKKKLTLAENKLTDIRLEALSSVHQVDQLKDYLEKMKNEINSLKSENQALKSHIKESQTLNISTRKAQGLGNDDNGPKNNTNFALIDEYYLNSNTNPNHKINQIFQALNTNLNTYYYSYNFLLGDENESLLRKTLVTVECSYQLKLDTPGSEQTDKISTCASFKNNSEFFEYEVCTINLDSKLKWDLMDGIISYVFKRYINKIDPGHKLGLDQDSIDKYYIGEIMRKINDTNYPAMLPFGYLVGSSCTIRIILKDNYRNLDSLCYETMIPKFLLEDYVSLLENNRLIGINSMHKFGKTYLMRKLGQFISKNSDKDIEMIYYNMEDLLSTNQNNMLILGEDNSKGEAEHFMEIKQKLLINIEMKIRGLDSEKSVMILLDNFHSLFLNNSDLNSRVPVEIIQSILKLIQRNKLYMIVTTQETSSVEASLNCLFEFNQSFKWINLSGEQLSFLHLYLTRNLIDYQVEQQKLKESCVIMEKVVHFIVNVFKLVNELMMRLGFTIDSTNLINFMNMPFGVETSEKWFVQLWNYTIIPHLNDVIKAKLITYEKHRFNIKQTDPTEWIINNYVWPRTDTNINLQQRFLSVKYLNEIKTNRISSSSDDSEFNIHNRSVNKNQNLISMLQRLKKTTYKEDTSSGFFDSNESNSSNASPKSNSPTISTMNLNFKDASDFFNSIKTKTKIESSL